GVPSSANRSTLHRSTRRDTVKLLSTVAVGGVAGAPAPRGGGGGGCCGGGCCG
ncbi:zinc ribbon domain-containing protein, partial [Streptomyces achromogenes]|uniref:zinc ribbon domain-containing protein n=1 Tax=Streptomyces achromogenes TaxID=67255 RepID=UPI003A80DC8B